MLQMADIPSLSGYSSVPGSLSTAAVPLAGSLSRASSSVPSLGRMISSNFEHNASNDSSSPTLSDSGISVDAASNGSSARVMVPAETTVHHRALTNTMSLSSAGPGMIPVS